MSFPGLQFMQNVFSLLCVENGFTNYSREGLEDLMRAYALCMMKNRQFDQSTHLIFTVTGLTADCNCRNRVFFRTPLHLSFSSETKHGLATVEST